MAKDSKAKVTAPARPKDSKAKVTESAREVGRQIAQMISEYNAQEGMGPHEPITADTLYHAVAFVDGKPPKSKKAAAASNSEA